VLSHLYVSPSQCQSFPTRRSSDLRIRTSCAPRTRLADLEGPRPARGTPADEEEEEETPAEASFQGRLEVRQGEQTPQEHGALHPGTGPEHGGTGPVPPQLGRASCRGSVDEEQAG